MTINELNKLSCEVICNTEEETDRVIELANKLGGKGVVICFINVIQIKIQNVKKQLVIYMAVIAS